MFYKNIIAFHKDLYKVEPVLQKPFVTMRNPR